MLQVFVNVIFDTVRHVSGLVHPSFVSKSVTMVAYHVCVTVKHVRLEFTNDLVKRPAKTCEYQVFSVDGI